MSLNWAGAESDQAQNVDLDRSRVPTRGSLRPRGVKDRAAIDEITATQAEAEAVFAEVFTVSR